MRCSSPLLGTKSANQAPHPRSATTHEALRSRRYDLWAGNMSECHHTRRGLWCSGSMPDRSSTCLPSFLLSREYNLVKLHVYVLFDAFIASICELLCLS